MTDRIYNVLFLCTGNSARSVLAESQLNALGKGRFKAWSAGSFPAGRVHPRTLQLLQSMSLPTAGLRSKSWAEFARADAPAMDFVFTVCESASPNRCDLRPGDGGVPRGTRQLERGSRRRRGLDHGRLLVHGVDLVRQSRRDDRACDERQLCGDTSDVAPFVVAQCIGAALAVALFRWNANPSSA